MEIIAPWLAAGLAIGLTGHLISKLARKAIIQIGNKDYKLLDVLHHLTSGVKAFSTDCAYRGIDEMR